MTPEGLFSPTLEEQAMNESSHGMKRMMVQALFCVPILPAVPFAIFGILTIFFPDYWTSGGADTLHSMIVKLLAPASTIAILALFSSILLPSDFVSRFSSLRVLLICGLAVCCFEALYLMLGASYSATLREAGLGTILPGVVFVGPLLVGLWNLIRFVVAPKTA